MLRILCFILIALAAIAMTTQVAHSANCQEIVWTQDQEENDSGQGCNVLCGTQKMWCDIGVWTSTTEVPSCGISYPCPWDCTSKTLYGKVKITCDCPYACPPGLPQSPYTEEDVRTFQVDCNICAPPE